MLPIPTGSGTGEMLLMILAEKVSPGDPHGLRPLVAVFHSKAQSASPVPADNGVLARSNADAESMLFNNGLDPGVLSPA